MYRLLIVDDEAMVVDYLTEVFSDVKHLDLDIFSAYSAAEALEWLDRTRIDIVLSDIQMPGMTGLELQKEIVGRWPRCKIIFLTGYNNFEFAREALRQHSTDYLLKTEGDIKILEAVDKAVGLLEEEIEYDNLLRTAGQQLKLAMPTLQKEFLLDILEGNKRSLHVITKQFEELQIRLNPQTQVLLILGRIDDWHDYETPSDRMLIQYAIQNITQEILSSSAQMISIVYDRFRLIWLIQPLLSESQSYGADEIQWKRTMMYVQGNLDRIQTTCKQLLKISFSFFVGNDPSSWEFAGGKLIRLMELCSRDFGMGRQLLLVESQVAEYYGKEEGKAPIKNTAEKLDLLQYYFESGRQDEFFDSYHGFMEILQVVSTPESPLRAQVYYGLAAMYLTFINDWEMLPQISTITDFSKLTRLESHKSWEEVVAYFEQLARLMFQERMGRWRNDENKLIQKIKEYIEHHLSGDLSLTRIAEVVGYNSSYLSRLYKQMTDEGLSDTITNARVQRAKTLLGQTDLKIHEVASAVGFELSSHFSRFFKKETHLTPQEYRDTLNK